LKQLAQQFRRIVDPVLHAALEVDRVNGEFVRKLLGFEDDLRHHAADQRQGDERRQREDSQDGARARSTAALDKIDHGIQQIGNHPRHGQRPKHGRKQMQHLAQPPHGARDHPDDECHRQRTHRQPHQSGLFGRGRREVHKISNLKFQI